MTGRFLTLLVIAMLASPAAAQTVQVRTGEHQGFTRVVLSMPGRIAWRMDRSGADATLIFDDPGLTFDISAAFDRITQDRLKAVDADLNAAELNLKLGCECKLISFWHTDRILVIDIADDKTVAINTKPQRKPALKTETTDQSLETPVILQQPGFQSAVFPVERLNNLVDTDPLVEIAEKNQKMRQPELRKDQKRLSETRDRLLQQIGRAATQGLLTPRSEFPSRNETEKQDGHAKPDTSLAENPSVTIVGKSIKRPSENINLKAQTSIDRDFMQSLGLSGHAFDVSHCIAASRVDVSAWGEAAPFSLQIGAVRTRLTEEFDKTNQGAAIELVKLYIYFGFGVEARQILALVTEKSLNSAVLHDMAFIIEEEHAPVGSILFGQLECESPVALWSALAYQALPKDIPIETNAVLRAFSGLPVHLRRHLGPVLSRRFLQAGYKDIAEKLLRIVNRTKDVIPQDANILQAEMDIAGGDNKTAESALEIVVKSNAEHSAEALLRLIKNRLKTGSKISFEVAQLAGAYALENRGTAIGHDLSLAYISSLASSGAFDQSYRELERLKPQLSPKDIHAVQNRILAILTHNADEITFLRYALSGSGYTSSALDSDVANATARRLLAAGFTPAAGPLVATPIKGPDGEARQLIRAEISLKEGRPRQAEVDLLGLSGVDANLLRARARSDVGEHLAAFQLYKSNQMDAEATRSAWLAEDWDRLSRQDDLVLADVARLMQSSLAIVVEDDIGPDQSSNIAEKSGVLAQNRKLLEDSGTSRNTLAALLASKRFPVGLDE